MLGLLFLPVFVILFGEQWELAFIPHDPAPTPMTHIESYPLREIPSEPSVESSIVSPIVPRVEPTYVAPPQSETKNVQKETGGFDILSTISKIVFGIWGTGTVLLLLRLLFSMFAARRLMDKMVPVENESLQTMCRELSQKLRVRRLVELLQSEVGTVPFTLGSRNPKIVFPRSAIENWNEPQLRAIMTHELAHVQRGDMRGELFAQIVSCFYWFHPLVWLAVRRIRIERELACDDMVLTGGEKPTDYAETLLELSSLFSSCHRHALGCGVALFERKNTIPERIASILNKKTYRNPIGRIGTAFLFLLTLGGVAFASMLSPYENTRSERVLLLELRERLKTMEPTPAEKTTIAELRQKTLAEYRRKETETPPSEKETLENEQLRLELRFFTITKPYSKAILENKAMHWTGLPGPETTKPLSAKPNETVPKLTPSVPLPILARFMEQKNADQFLELFCSFSFANCLQAPTITLNSNEEGRITDISQTPFVTSVIPVESNGTMAYEPVIQIFGEGISWTIKATVLEDHSCRIESCIAEFSRIESVNIVKILDETPEKKTGVSIQIPKVNTFSVSIPKIEIPAGMSLLVAVPGEDLMFVTITPRRITPDENL